jgi:hypothetical protein
MNYQNMKKILRLITYVLFIALSYSATGQIPNAGFEDWDSIGNYEKPLGWITNQTQELARLERDTVRVEGTYSLKLFPSTGNWFDGCESYLHTTFRISEPYEDEQSLYFNYKIISDTAKSFSGAYLRYSVRAYISDGNVEYIDSTFTEDTPDFKEIEIPLLHTAIDSMTISFSGGSRSHGADDICYLRSFSWVDNLRIMPSTLTRIEHIRTDAVSVFPNPSNGFFQIDGDWQGVREYAVYSIFGEVVARGILSRPEIYINEPGMYVLVLSDPHQLNNPEVIKIVIQQ